MSLLLGGALLTLAIPRTLAALYSLKALPAFEKIADGKPPTNGDLIAAAVGLTAAVAAAPSGEKLVKLGTVEMLQALDLGPDEAQRAGLLARSEHHLNEGLLANPTQTLGWLTLAEVRIVRGANGRDVAIALMHSVDVGPNTRFAWIPRAKLLLRYWQLLDIEALPVFSAQIRTIWSASPAYRAQLTEAAIAVDEMEVVAAVVGEPPATPDELRAMQGRKALRIRSAR